jgi:hypothetical protein
MPAAESCARMHTHVLPNTITSRKYENAMPPSYARDRAKDYTSPSEKVPALLRFRLNFLPYATM